MAHLLDPITLGALTLSNRAVMCPLTRCRALGNVPNALMATYYEQRAGAGLIITEGISPSPNGLGYARMPGIFSEAQVQGWRAITQAVHAKGGRIFAQLMHAGRVGHIDNLPTGARLVGPMTETIGGEMWTDTQGLQANSEAAALSEAGIEEAIAEYVQAAKNAVAAGFDGVELHGANGYLIEQFLNANANRRSDDWGGSAQARNRFALRVAQATVDAIGADKVGIRISPYGVNKDTGAYDGVDEQYHALIEGLSAIGLVYLHVLDHSPMGAPAVPASIKAELRKRFKGRFILAGGFDAKSAEVALSSDQADMIAFGRPFIANPDLVDRVRSGAAWALPDPSTFYSAAAEGYTDYPRAV